MKKKVKKEDPIILIHYREPGGEYNFKIVGIRVDVEKEKLLLMVAGNEDIHVPILDFKDGKLKTKDLSGGQKRWGDYSYGDIRDMKKRRKSRHV